MVDCRYKTSSKYPSRISARVYPSEPVSAQYDHNHAPPTASALRKQRFKSTLLNADLLKGFAEISEDVEIRPSERKAARQVFYRLKKAKRSDWSHSYALILIIYDVYYISVIL